MLIEISDSVLTNEHSSIHYNVIIDALESLALARYEGKHSIIASRETLKQLSQCDDLSPRAKKIYEKLFHEFTQLQLYKSCVNMWIEVVTPCSEPIEVLRNNKKIIQVSPTFFQDTQSIQKTILLCENLDDCKFYEFLAKVYVIWSKLSHVHIACDSRSGGGSTITDIYNDIQNQDTSLCLCIVDSDRLAPDDSLGATAKTVKAKDDITKKMTNLHIVPFREVENLIPNELIECLKDIDLNARRSLDLLRDIQKSEVPEIRLFVDMKEGSYLEKIVHSKNPDVANFWKARIPKIPKIQDRSEDWCLENWECDVSSKSIDCRCQISPGLGNRLLNRTLDYLDTTHPHDISRLVQPPIRSEWEHLGQVIVDWCFSKPPIRA